MRLTGILTNRDLRFEKNHSQLVSSVMTKENLVTVPVGTTLEESRAHPAKAPHRGNSSVVDQDFNLKGLITVKDIQKKLNIPARRKMSMAIARGRRRGRDGRFSRTGRRNVEGESPTCWPSTRRTATPKRVMEAIKAIRQRLPEMQLVAGNVATYEGAKN